jgi:hypothetical protein
LVRLPEAADVKTLWAAAVLLLGLSGARAQEVTLPPMVVTGTFLRQGPSTIDLFTQHLQGQMEAKRALDEATARAPLFNAKFWS